MHHPTTRSLIVSALLLVLAASTAPALGQVSRASNLRAQSSAVCPSLATYAVGAAPTPATTPGSVATPAPGVQGMMQPGGLFALKGTLTLTGYGGCSGATAGTFSVHAVISLATSPVPPSASGTQKGIVMPGVVGTTVLTATGSFAQDPGHAGSPMYVLVSARVVYGSMMSACAGVCRRLAGTQIACVNEDDCPKAARMVVAGTSVFSGVTGYVLVDSSRLAALGLTFLPPPTGGGRNVSVYTSMQPITLWGTRSAK
jgi:hypothetical protein